MNFVGIQSHPRPTLFALMRRLWPHVQPRRRRQFAFLLGLMVLTSFTEVFSIGAVLPFLGVLTSPDTVFEHRSMQPVVEFLNLSNPDQLLLPITILFCAAALLAGGMRILLLWVNTRVSHAVGADLSLEAYRRTLYQPYAVHIARNSSEIINGVSGKISKLVGGLILPLLTLFSSAVLLTAILVTLLSIDPLVALGAFTAVGIIYSVVIRLTRYRLRRNSEQIATLSTEAMKALSEGLGGIRDVLINSAQPILCEAFHKADRPMRHAYASNAFLGMAPRYGIEAFGMIAIALVAYVISIRGNGIASALPALGALALGAQRLLPVVQQAYSSWTAVLGSRASIEESVSLLEQPLPEKPACTSALPFRHLIELDNVGFRYAPAKPWVLKNIRLLIRKGDRVGFVGATGSGKSTLVDIVMGLLKPDTGKLIVDGRAITGTDQNAWQSNIAHVPQAIYLSDNTIKENIAFGIKEDEIDLERVKQAARQAQIDEMIEGLADGYNTVVGERGVRLSGGQRQRIGIARALYKNASVIVFDEATSALDHETERAVMEAIEGLGQDLTILIIAHRVSTLRNCNSIVEMKNGRIERIGSYETIISKTDRIA